MIAELMLFMNDVYGGFFNFKKLLQENRSFQDVIVLKKYLDKKFSKSRLKTADKI